MRTITFYPSIIEYIVLYEYLGVAYSFNHDVYINNKCNSNLYGFITKTKCIALFDADQKLKSFGIDAKHELIIFNLY